MATVDDKKIIFSMVGLNKTIRQNNKQVLKNIYLSFFYGAKIGIIGMNGSGKSTLMKIIAGLDNDYQGEVVWSPGYSVGYLPQEPQLQDGKTVKEVVMEGVQSIVDALNEYEEINNKFGLPEYYEDEEKMNALFARQAELQDIIDATDAWNLDSKLERAMAALRCPAPDELVDHLSGGERRRLRFAVCCCRNPMCCSSTSLPTTSMPRVLTGWNSTSTNTKVPSLRLPTTAISSTMLQAGYWSSTVARESPGKETTLRGSTRKPSVWSRKRRVQASAARLLNASWNGCVWHRRPARQRVRPV